MKTSKLICGLAATAWLATSGVAIAAPTSTFVVLTSAVGQTGKPKSGNDRQEVDSLLQRARQAMKQGDMEKAESLIGQAEQRKVDYSMFHLGDTPKKARADLSAARRGGKKGAPERPSKKYTPDAPAEKSAEAPVEKASAEPPLSRLPAVAPRVPAEVSDPADEAPINLPSTEDRMPVIAPAGRVYASPEQERGTTTEVLPPVQEHPVGEPGRLPAAPTNAPLSPQRAESDQHLLSARRALAVGDVRRASAAVEAARKLNVPYTPHDDSPDKVDTAIRNYRQVLEVTKGRQDEAARHQVADRLMEQAQQLMRWKDYEEAERLVHNIQGMRVNFGPFETKPEALLEKITAARRQVARGGQTPGAQVAGGAPSGMPDAPGKYPVARAAGGVDRSRNRTVAGQEGIPKNELPPPAPTLRRDGGDGASTVSDSDTAGDADAVTLVRQGEQALKDRDLPRALDYFKQAYEHRDQLNAAMQQRLQDHMQLLSAPAPGSRPTGRPGTLVESPASQAQLDLKKLQTEVVKKQLASGKVREKDPKRALELLKEAQALIEAASIEADGRAQLSRRVDKSIADLDKYIADNRAQIELDAANAEVLKEVERRQQTKIEVDDRLAKIVDEFNKLMDEERWDEAEVLAKRARELDPDNPVVKQLVWEQKLIKRNTQNGDLKERKEKGTWEAWHSVEEASEPFDDRNPIHFPDVRKWDDLTKTRKQQLAKMRGRRTERELEIEQKLKTPVSCKFRNRPLSEVLDHLQKLTGVNMYLDPKGIDEEGVSSDTVITIDLTHDISLKSALNLILEPLRLSYVIKDEVLKITSEQLRDSVLVNRTYNVADLVIPIPNFVPNGRMGLAGALSEAMSISGGGMGGMGGGPGTAYLASHDGAQATGVINPAVLAQMNQLMPGMGTRPAAGAGQSVPFGPGGAGGGSQPDFDTLIELITSTVKPQTWDEVGGPGTISPFASNLSLVISQTQEVHEEIVDLLEQLRANQDLQVTIEVRFITLNDNFFERIGVDFQFNINNEPPRDPTSLGNKKEIVGLLEPAAGAPFPNFTSNFDIPFRQNSFNLAQPQFGQPVQVADFGFAILSDLEAYLLVSAAQGDRRSNVLQAPKVTMFNGQQASVFDQTSVPFVVSVIPVVGDFAAAYQPVITVLSEGTALTVQATISNDRRFVRLTVLPFFSQIGEVKDFTFSGSKTTTNRSSANSSKGGTGGDSTASTGDATTSTDGVTIQLPSLAFVTVNTTVSVPDGGTVLLGGIKRLSEGRNEFGVPILSKVPYINRLFKNVGIGRETQSLMMMVTPRIIIQEEEEERLGIQAPP